MRVNVFKSGVWSVNDVYEKIKLNEWKFYDPDAPGQLWVWGSNEFGLLGINSTSPSEACAPIQVPGDNWKIANFLPSALALKGDGTMWSWGAGSSGRTGLNSVINRSSPTQIPGTAWCAIGFSNRAIKTDNTLWSWGVGTSGATGLNSVINRSSPTQIPGTEWCAVTINHALKTDGTLWGWGPNCVNYFGGAAGNVGDGTTFNRSSPVQIPGTQWVSIGSGDGLGVFSFGNSAIKSDGTLWRWGANGGDLGNNSTVSTISPIQIPGTWVIAGENKALKSDGTLWSWGNNSGGQVGDGSFIDRSSPVQIPGSWFRVNNGPQALKTDGTLWAWGSNGCGRLGIGCTDFGGFVARTPRQVDGLWKNIPSTGTRGAIRSE